MDSLDCHPPLFKKKSVNEDPTRVVGVLADDVIERIRGCGFSKAVIPLSFEVLGELEGTNIKSSGGLVRERVIVIDRGTSGICRRVVQGGPERSWSTKGGHGPRGPPGPLRSTLIHTFGNFTENVDQGGSRWTRRTRGTKTPLVGPGVAFTFC